MDFYRIAVVQGGVQRVGDFPATELSNVVREAQQAGFRVSYVLLPATAERLPGILEEPTDLLTH